MFDIFPPHGTDGYKTGHKRQFPDGTSFVYSNLTCRSDKLFNALDDFDHKVVFFGLQGVLQWLLVDDWNRLFFQKPRDEVVKKYARRMESYLGKGAVDIEAMAKLHDLGYLPILIKALPEGSRVDIRVPVYTIQNTHPDFFWLTNYLETQLSAETWKGITTATTAYEYKRLLTSYAKRTGTPLDFVPWQGHDFSMRRMSGLHDAVMSGAAHLTSFTGTDTFASIDYLEDFYGASGLIGGSVPATEHAVQCMGGEDNELETYSRLINKIYPTGIVSIVSDTWDFWQVLTEYTIKLKDDILKRDGKVVFRPDSGDPVKIICGDSDAPPGSPEFKGAVECLWDVFGGIETSTGHNLLDSHVGLIYGDSITLDRAERILDGLDKKGFASGNIVFGIGSYTYQHVTRDSLGSAIKATFGVVNGQDREIFKKPKTDSGMKNSAKGLLRVEYEDGKFILYDQQTRDQEKQGLLRPVFLDGKLLNKQTFTNIKEKLNEVA